MSLCRQAAGVAEGGVVHAQLRRPLVHPLHKGILTAGQMLCQRHSAVIGRHHADRFEHIAHRQLFPLLQPDLAAAHGAGVGGGCDHVLIVENTAVDGLHDQQNGHDLGDAGRFQLRVFVLGVKYGTGVLFHQQCRGGGYLHGPNADAQSQNGAQKRQCFFHSDLPFLRRTLYEKIGNFIPPPFFVLQNPKWSVIIRLFLRL